MARVILITGCSRGFGLLTAVECARRGGTVVATLRDLGKRQALDEAAAQAGVSLEVRRLDVADPESRRACVDAVLAAHGRIDVLVNNAGYGVFGAFEDVPEESLRRLMETDFFGAVELTRAVLPAMRAQGRGTIVNVTSAQGRAGLPGFSVYGAGKFALEGFSQGLAHEVGPLGIRVTCIEPGSSKTDFSFASLERRPDPVDGPYARLLAAVDRFIDPRLMSSPRTVARRIARACFARRPAARIPVGLDARALLLAQAVLGIDLLRWITRTVLPRLAPRSAGRPAAVKPGREAA